MCQLSEAEWHFTEFLFLYISWEIWRLEAKQELFWISHTVLIVYRLTWLMWVSSWTNNAPHFLGSSSTFDSWARNVCFLHQNRPWFLQDIHTNITGGNKNWHGFQPTFVGFSSCLWVPTYSWSPPPYTHLLVLPACLWTLNCSMRHEDKESQSQVAQSCPTLCDPMDCSLPGSSIHGIFQARILE